MLSIINMTHTGKLLIGVSACLLGQPVRFDGGHKKDDFLTQACGPFFEWVPVCPEVEAGMGVPREAVRLVGGANGPRMIAEKSARDWSAVMERLSRRRVEELSDLGLSGYVFKKNSPSCGLMRVKLYHSKNQSSPTGRGLFAAAVTAALPLLPVEEEGRLNDMALRENFIERVFAYARWQAANAGRRSIARLIEFHARHKYLLLAHSERHYRELGRLVAKAKSLRPAELYATYGRTFMAALAIHATARKHSNVLDHMMGYVSDHLSSAERRDWIELIDDYRRQLIPLIVPVTLLRHYASKYHVDYLCQQFYLEPNPKELMLRNHV